MTTRLEASHWLLQHLGLIEEFWRTVKGEGGKRRNVQPLEITAGGEGGRDHLQCERQGILEGVNGGRLELEAVTLFTMWL